MILVADTETTDIEEPQCIELAYRVVTLTNGLLTTTNHASFCERYLPSKPISYGAMATHHITLADLKDCRPHTEAKLPDGTAYLIGHNVDFDWKVLGCPEVKRIDTLAMARKMWPDMDSHKLGAIVYRLFPDDAKGWLQSAHSAAADVDMCCWVLDHMCRMIRPASIEALYEFSENARVPTHITFGKYKGLPIKAIPADYKQWLLRQPDVDPYLAQALRAPA